jgi:curved DNA-binding protein CbpA
MPLRNKDYYKILQVDPAADQEVIEAAYKRLARKYHPDMNTSPDATLRMQEMNAAYGVLRRPVTRAQYDKERSSQSSGSDVQYEEERRKRAEAEAAKQRATKKTQAAQRRAESKQQPPSCKRNPGNASILEFWRAVEIFSPQNVPKSNPRDLTEPVFLVAEDSGASWESSHPLRKRFRPTGTTWRHTVYCGIYGLEKVREILEEQFGPDPESFDERADGESCLFAFSVTDEGRPLFDSFVVSTCAWATGRTIAPGPASADWLQGFEPFSERLAAGFKERLALLDGDDRGFQIQSWGFPVGRPISYKDIAREATLAAQQIGAPSLTVNLEIRIKSALVSSKRQYTSDDQDFLNSFFISDLAKVASEAGHNNLGKGLGDYLRQEHEIDVRHSIPTLFQQLSPALSPHGRWPSKDHHPLVFRQQFAVNSIEDAQSKHGFLDLLKSLERQTLCRQTVQKNR